jgi:hypothetical protein
MPCRACGSENLGSFNGEIAIHFRGLKNIDQPTVFVFPELLICLSCGITEFVIPEGELRLLEKGRGGGAQ